MKLTNREIKDLIKWNIKSLKEMADLHEKFKAFYTAKNYRDKAKTLECLLISIEALEQE